MGNPIHDVQNSENIQNIISQMDECITNLLQIYDGSMHELLPNDISVLLLRHNIQQIDEFTQLLILIHKLYDHVNTL